MIVPMPERLCGIGIIIVYERIMRGVALCVNVFGQYSGSIGCGKSVFEFYFGASMPNPLQ